MTLALSTLTSSGITLTADSRQTYRNNAGMARIGPDNVIKLFALTDSIGVAIDGKAFLLDANSAPKNVGYFVEEFKSRGGIDLQLTVKDISGEVVMGFERSCLTTSLTWPLLKKAPSQRCCASV
jgi:hypothetical protein